MSKNNNPNSVSANNLGDVTYIFGTHAIGTLEGKILTLIEASTADAEQRKALKDVFRQEIWNWAISHNLVDTYDWEKSKLEFRAIEGNIGAGIT